jgi:hypothetical protein
MGCKAGAQGRRIWEAVMMLRRFISTILAIALSAVPSAYALTGSRDLLLSGGPPSWILAGASIDINLGTGQYYGCTVASCISISRASSKTNLLPSSASGFAYSSFANGVAAITPGLGLLIEESRINQLFNSATPATQTTGSLATGAYTIWVNGSGSATMSSGTGTGCGTGVATQGTAVNFTMTVAGTCTVTVSGSLNAFQLELGAFGTSLIVTAGATGTRAADVVTASGALLAQLAKQGTSLVMSAGGLPSPANQNFANFIGLNSQASFCMNGTNPAQMFSGDSSGGNSFTSNFGTGTAAAPFIWGLSWAVGSTAVSVAGNAVGTTANSRINAAVTSALLGSFSGSQRFIDTYIVRITLWNTQIPNATLKALT